MNQLNDTLYFHSDKYEMSDQFEDICCENNVKYTEKSLERSMYTGYEIEIKGYWTPEGDFYATHFMDEELTKQVKI